MRLIGQLVGESDGGPLGGLNVRGYAYGGDDELLSLGHGTADEDGSFSLEAGWSEISPTGDSLRLRFEVLDGRLDLIHALEQEIAVDSPDSPANVTVVVPFAVQRETADEPAKDDKAAGVCEKVHPPAPASLELSVSSGARADGSDDAP